MGQYWIYQGQFNGTLYGILQSAYIDSPVPNKVIVPFGNYQIINDQKTRNCIFIT